MNTGPAWTVAGPADRTTFLEEQARRRAQTWRVTVLSAFAAAIVGVPLAMFLTPVAYLLVVGLLRSIHRSTPVPETVWAGFRNIAQFVPKFLDALAEAPDETVGIWLRHAVNAVDYPFGSPAVTVAALIVPGMIAMVLVWLGYRALFRNAGVSGAVLALGAREPHLDDLEERQLVNLVDEMAIAAGLPPPQVRLLDSPAANAAAIGSSHENAVIVVSRGLLDRMNRDETQGVIGHLVASVGNGDLAVAFSITTVFQSIELVFTALDALFNLSGAAWRDLFWTMRLAVTGGRDARAADVVARMMDHRLGEMREDGVSALLDDWQRDQPRGRIAKVLKRLPMLTIVFLPFLLLYVLSLFLRMQVSMFRITVVGPLLMRVWKTRRFLADATAVQLTRNPDGLAQALGHLAEDGAVVAGSQWFAHLFIVGPEAVQARHDARLQRRMAVLRERTGTTSLLDAAAGASHAVRDHAQHGDASKGTWAKELAGVASHPSIVQRVHRLELQGAASPGAVSVGDTRTTRPGRMPGGSARRWGARQTAFGILGAIVLVPLGIVMASLMAFAMSAIFLFGLVSAVFFMGIAMAGIFALIGPAGA